MRHKKTLLVSLTILAIAVFSAGLQPAHASVPPPWIVSLDANSTGNTDANPQPSNTVVKTFNVGAIVNASSSQPLNGVFGWQFGIIYDNTTVIPQGDPFAIANDGAQSTANFGAQTTTGNPNWAGMVSAFHVFAGSHDIAIDSTHREVFVFLAILYPNLPVTISPALSSTVKGNLLANVAFELLRKPSSPITFSITDVIFADRNSNPIPNITAGSAVTVTINNDPPVASFTATPIPSGDPSCTPITGAPCTANALRYDGSASSAASSNTITNPNGYFWDFGDGTQDNTNNPSCGLLNCNQGPVAIHDYGVPGKFKVTLRVVDTPAGATGSARDTLGNPIINKQPSHKLLTLRVGNSINTPPLVSFTESATTVPTMSWIYLTISASDIDGTITSLIVVWGDGTVYDLPVTQTFASYAYPRAGTYAVYVNATDDEGATTQSSIAIKTVTDRPPSVGFTESATAALKGTPISLNITSSDPDGTVTSLQVTWGDGTVDTLRGTATADTHVYQAAGTYSVYINATDNSGTTTQSAIASKTIFDHPPVVRFTESASTVLTGTPITIDIFTSDPTGTVTSLKVSWGDGTVDTLPGDATSDTHSYASTGNDKLATFTVYVNATDNSGMTSQSSRSTKTILDRPPTVGFTESATTVQSGTPVTLTIFATDPDGTLSTLTVSWGDGTVDVLPGAAISDTHSYASTISGNVIVTVSATDNSNSSSSSFANKIIFQTTAPPSVSFSETATYDSTGVPITLTITASSSNGSVNSLTVYWGDGTIDTLPRTATSDSHAYAAAGSYTVYVVATDSSGQSSQSGVSLKTIIDRSPTASYTETTTTAPTGTLITFDGSASSDPDGTIVSYSWAFGDGTSGAGKIVSHSYAFAGAFVPFLIVTDNNQFASLASSVKYITDRPPVAAFSFSPTSPAVGQTVSFDASSSNDPDGIIVSYTWDFGDGTTGSGQAATHVYTAPASVTVILVVTDNNGSTGTAMSTVTFQQSGGHASLFSWGVRAQWKKFSIAKQGPVEPIQAFAVNDANRTLWLYVQFKVTSDGGVSEILYTQVVQLAPGQTINGNEDPRFEARFTPRVPSVYIAQATVYYSVSSTMPPIGDPTFIGNLSGQKSTSIKVSP